MDIRKITAENWRELKEVRLASLRDSPHAFGVKYEDALKYSRDDWKERASSKNAPSFFLVFNKCAPIGIVGGKSSPK